MLYCQFEEYKADVLMDVWFQKTSIPPPQRKLEILKGLGGGGGGGVQRPRKFRGREVECLIWFPDALGFNMGSKILAYLLSRSVM